MENQPLFLTSHSSDQKDFTLDSIDQKLRCENGEVRLRPKLWKVFVALLQNENQLIEREALIDLVWNGNRFTGPQGVSHAICVLRGIITELELPIIIITLPKRGYILQRATITPTQSLIPEFDVVKYDQSYG